MRLFSAESFLDPWTCAAFRRALDAGEVEEAEVIGRGIHPQRQVRRATLVEPSGAIVNEVETRLESMREPVAGALGLRLGGREGPGFVRYPAGGFYRPHRDRGHDPKWQMAAHRAVALVAFLNNSRDADADGDFDGGILRLLLPEGPIDVVPRAGLLVAFPADVLHEVTEVRGGTRDTIVDWFYEAR